MRVGLLLVLAVAVACSGADYRPEQIWVVDFQTHAGELLPLLAGHGIDPADVEARVLDHLYAFYRGLPIRFDLGDEPLHGPSNYVCVRTTDTDLLGNAVLDPGNTTVDFNCGGNLGVFLDNVLGQFDNQSTEPTAERLSLFLAMILAHEIGHSLGLPHTDGSFGLGDIMHGTGIYDVQRVEYAFIPSHRALLAENLSHE